jgi:glyoxylase-like metal-dependent hydrolase (beta-lactamase superfamily II)
MKLLSFVARELTNNATRRSRASSRVSASSPMKEQALASIDRVAKLLTDHKAQLWIGHDTDVTVRITRAPKFYD